MKHIFVLAVLVAVVWYAFQPPDSWEGYVYPDRTDLSQHQNIGTFDTLEECRDNALAYGDRIDPTGLNFDYECGLNCSARSEYELLPIYWTGSGVN